jgi:hypothetical protein
MRRPGMSRNVILAALLQMNKERCRPPLPTAEVQRIAESIGAKPPAPEPPPEGEPPPPRTFRVIADVDLAQLPPLTWIIENILPAGGFSVLFGPPSSGKSFLALDWARCVGRGEPWQGRRTIGRSVLYIAAEGTAGLRQRFTAIQEAHGIAGSAGVFFIPAAAQLMQPADQGALIQTIQDNSVTAPLVVVDTLARCLVGGEENSAKDVGEFIAGCDRLRAELGATVLLVHHTGKAGDVERGSSTLRGAADMMAQLTQDGDVLSLTCEKMKESEPFTKLYLRRRVVDLGDGTTSCVIGSYDPLPGEMTSKQRQALDALKLFEDGASGSEWRDTSGLPKSTFYHVRHWLEKAEIVTKTGRRYRVKNRASNNQTAAPD